MMLCSVVTTLADLERSSSSSSGGGGGSSSSSNRQGMPSSFWRAVQEWYLSNRFGGMDIKVLMAVTRAFGVVRYRAGTRVLQGMVGAISPIGLDQFDPRSLTIISAH